MKITLIPLLILVSFHFSCRTNCGPSWGLGIGTIGFADSDQVFVVKKFTKGSSFGSFIDSVIVDSSYRWVFQYHDTAVYENFMTNLLMPGYDYEIDFVKIHAKHRISDIREVQITQPYTDKSYCTNPIVGYRLDEIQVNRGFNDYSALYFHK